MVFIIEDLKQNLLRLNKYNINKSQVAYKLCEEIEIKGIKIQNLFILESATNELLNILPAEEYEIQIEITEQIVTLMKFWYGNTKYKKDEKDFIAQYFFILRNYRNLAGLLSMLGIYGLSWEYLMKGIWPNYKEKGLELDNDIIYSIWKLGIETIPQARSVIMEVCSCYFYLGRILGHNYEESYALYNITKKWLKIGIEAINDDIDYLCFACSLFNLHNNQEMKGITDTLTAQYYIEISRNKEGAFRICYTLHDVNIITKKIKTMWAVNGVNILDDLKTNNKESRVVLELSILLNKHSFRKIKVRNEIIAYLEYLENTISDSTIRGFQKQKMSVIINNCILYSIKHNENEFAAECAYIWKTYPHNTKRHFKMAESLLIILSNFKIDMITYLIYHNNKGILLEFPKKTSLRKLIDSKNEFDGNWTVITGENLDKNCGYANENLALTYMENLEQFYCPFDIVKEIKLIKDINIINIIELPWVNSPMESLIGIHWDKSISTLVSGNPKDQRVIKNILIWCDPDCSLPSAIIEKELVEYNLINCEGVNVNIYIGEECSYDLFCEKYKDENYDMIWLMCHGNFNYDNPSNSYLHISKDKPIAINELIDLIPHTDQRRLLVINACESGCSSIRSSGMNFVGFGASLSNQFQSVIGHLWPVDSFAASIFGAILSYNILSYNDWGKAINNTRKQMNDGNKAIEEFFKNTLKYEENSEIVQSLSWRSREMNELIFWGSPSFFK